MQSCHLSHTAHWCPAADAMSACVLKSSCLRPLTALCSIATMLSAADATVANNRSCCHVWHSRVSGWCLRCLQLLDAAVPHDGECALQNCIWQRRARPFDSAFLGKSTSPEPSSTSALGNANSNALVTRGFEGGAPIWRFKAAIFATLLQPVAAAEQGRRGGDDVLRATAELRSDLSRADGLTEERRRLHDAFKRQWNEDDIIQVIVLPGGPCGGLVVLKF